MWGIRSFHRNKCLLLCQHHSYRNKFSGYRPDLSIFFDRNYHKIVRLSAIHFCSLSISYSITTHFLKCRIGGIIANVQTSVIVFYFIYPMISSHFSRTVFINIHYLCNPNIIVSAALTCVDDIYLLI